VESVVQQPATLYSIDPEEWQAGGIKDNLVRYAVGIEDAEDLMTDLSQALTGVQSTTRRVQ
jgi:cystathionine beta-lyase/cystathionine gamma-synthase